MTLFFSRAIPLLGLTFNITWLLCMCSTYVPNYILGTYVLNCITIFMIAILYVFYIFDIYFATCFEICHKIM